MNRGSKNRRFSRNYVPIIVGSVVAASAIALGIYSMTKSKSKTGTATGTAAIPEPKIELDTSKYNMAICGPWLSGKATLINAMLGVAEKDPGSAPVELSKKPKYDPISYQIPDPENKQHGVIWYFPGWGAEHNTFKNYFNRNNLKNFNAVMLVYANGLDENTATLYRECVENKIPTMLVRTMADKAYDAKIRRMKPEQAIAEMRGEFEKETNDMGLDKSSGVKAFYVSIHDYVDGKGKMDEKKLMGAEDDD